MQARLVLGHARRARAALFPALIIVACAEGQALDRDMDGSGGRPATGGAASTTGGAPSGGVGTGGKAAGGASTGGKSAIGGASATGGNSAAGGTPGAAGSTLTGGPTCHFTESAGGDGGASGGQGTGVGASSGADAGGASTADSGGAGGASSAGGESNAGGAPASGGTPSAGGASTDSAGAAGFAGPGGGSGMGPTYAFCDDFEDGDAGGWAPQSCDWGVVSDDSFSLEGGPGSCQANAGESVWIDQIIEARVKVISFGGTSNSYRAGLIARSNGASNYYSFGIAGNGALRLLRGTSTLSGTGNCGDYSAGASADTWYSLRLEVTGPASSVRLRSFIDDRPAQDCTVTTSTAVSGTAGVFTYGADTSALFDDVRVWTP